MEIEWRQMPPLTALRAFQAVAQAGGFSAAARMLNVTHAAVAQQVRALEDLLDLPLVVRDGRRMALTPEGEELAARLNEGFGTIQAGLAALRAGGTDRPVRITLTSSFAAQWLMPRLRGFWDRHPDIGLSLHPDPRVMDLRREGMDLGIRYGDGQWPGVEARFLTSARLVVAAAPSLMEGRKTLTTSEMAGMDWILAENWPEQDQYLTSLGLDPASLSITQISDDALAVAAARQGLGLVVESAALLEDDARAGRLHIVHDSHDRLPAYFVIVPPGPPRAPVRTFLKWLSGIA
jgi:LysR family glycine cleavage system transcriptional activator